MTTDRQMAMMYAAQQEVIAALQVIGEPDLADRLERCMTVRRDRRGGDGWPHICRSAACVWCRRPMIRSWWYGMPMDGRGNHLEPCHHPAAPVGWLA